MKGPKLSTPPPPPPWERWGISTDDLQKKRQNAPHTVSHVARLLVKTPTKAPTVYQLLKKNANPWPPLGDCSVDPDNPH